MDPAADGLHRAGDHRLPGHLDALVRRAFRRPALQPVRRRPLVLAADQGKEATEDGGWTFLEILIVIAIILILTSAVGFMAFRYVDRARQVTARSQIESFSLALQAYAIDCKQYPTQEQGLQALWEKPILEPVPASWDGPYMEKKIPNDPWGRPYEYTVPGPGGLPFGLRSLGADGKEGGEGNDRDLASWQE